MKEIPIWRQILNWGCVVYFLTLPMLAIFIGFSRVPFGESTQIPSFLREFHFTVSALVAAIAGLNSFDRSRPANGSGEKKPDTTSRYPKP